MALGSLHFTSTTAAEWIPEIWLPKINEFYKANLVAADFFMDASAMWQASGGDILHIPTTSALTASSKSVASQVTLQSPTDSTVDLTINAWYESSFMIEDGVNNLFFKSYDVQEAYMRGAAYACAKALDTALTNLFAGFSQTTGASTAEIADSNIRVAIQYLDVANAPQEDRAFFLYPTTFWSGVQSIDRFALAVNSPENSPVGKRPAAYLYGYPVYMTTNLGTSTGSRLNAFAHKDALAFATTGVRLHVNYIPEYLGWLMTADIQYGVIENRDTSGVWIKTSS